MSVKEYEFHPYASVLPMLGTSDASELAADIQANGLREPITLFEGQILDGRNRYRACKLVGVEPRFRDFNGDGDPIDYIISVNVKRRHLTASQKAMVVDKFASLPRGNPKLKTTKNTAKPKYAPGAQLDKRDPETAAPTAEQLAKDLGVSARTVVDAKKVRREGSPELIDQVERGEKSVKVAVKEIKQTKAKEEKTTHLDKTGYPIPDSILADWQRAEAFGSNLREISRIKGELSKGLDDKDPIFIREMNSSAVSMLQNLYAELKGVIPYAVCTSCQGKQKTKCSLCKGSGFISQFAYNQFVPAETKELRKKVVQK